MKRCAALPLVVLAFAACHRPAPRDPSELVVGVATYPSDFDPRTGADQASDRLHALVYDGLFENGPDLRPVPVLVETVLQNGPLVYEFRLRAGVRFHDGRPFTSADAAFTLNSIIRGEVTSFRKGDLERIALVETPDPLTLRLTLREPLAPLLTNLNFGILPAGTTADQARDRPLGTGAWKFSSAENGREIRLAANPDYFRGAPGFPGLRLRALPDASTRVLEMKRGALDLISDDLPADALGALARDPRLSLASGPGTGFQYLIFNCAKPPFEDARVRRAIGLLIDRETALKYLYGGRGRLADSLLPSFHWAYAPPAGPDEDYRLDPPRALRLLDEAGLHPGPDGVRLRFTYRTASDSPESLAAAQYYQDLLGRAGIRMEIRATYWGFFFEALKKGDFQLAGGRWVGLTDPDGFRLRFGSAWFPPAGLNRGRFKAPALDEAVEAGAREADPEKRRMLYAQVQASFRRGAPYVPLFHSDISILHRRELAGVEPAPDGSFRVLRFIHPAATNTPRASEP